MQAKASPKLRSSFLNDAPYNTNIQPKVKTANAPHAKIFKKIFGRLMLYT